VTELRRRLYETGTRSLRTILQSHLSARDVDPSLALLTGAVLVRVTFEGRPATSAFIDDVVDRVLSRTKPRH
jgi:hypothetical protein